MTQSVRPCLPFSAAPAKTIRCSTRTVAAMDFRSGLVRHFSEKFETSLSFICRPFLSEISIQLPLCSFSETAKRYPARAGFLLP
ncbi:hypothetical protein KJ781_01080, partial [Patescibacteria group bacterium]|nr:hypothetical protein [Patescibacteria group bacterium]